MRAAILSGTKGPDAPSKISATAKGVIRIVETWEHLNVGLTERSAYRIALREARALCARLNAKEAHAEWMAGARLDREFA